jgi:flagellar hook-basal body complex protein FliE
MSLPITPITGISLPAAVRGTTAGPAGAGGASFADVFSSAVRDVESFSQNANASVGNLLNGENEELHTTIMATQRAELSFDLFLQVRNKVISAYQEIMRMPM